MGRLSIYFKQVCMYSHLFQRTTDYQSQCKVYSIQIGLENLQGLCNEDTKCRNHIRTVHTQISGVHPHILIRLLVVRLHNPSRWKVFTESVNTFVNTGQQQRQMQRHTWTFYVRIWHVSILAHSIVTWATNKPLDISRVERRKTEVSQMVVFPQT